MNNPLHADEHRSRWITEAVATYERRLITYAVRLTGDEARARDVVQDAFMKLWQADAASVNGHLAAWLYRVCRNRALDVMRKEGRMTALDTTSNSLSETKSQGAADDSQTDSESADSMMKMLEILPARQQEILRLKFQGELSYKEIAEVMDLTVSNVGFLIHVAIKTLREKLAGDSDSGGEATHGVAG